MQTNSLHRHFKIKIDFKAFISPRHVKKFTCLGSVITETVGTDEDITAKVRKTQSTFSMLMPVYKEKSIGLRTKLRIVNSNVKSDLLYGSETWRSTKLLIKKLKTFNNKCLREIRNICR